MKRILVISGSRADYGLLEWPVKVLRESFEVCFAQIFPDKPSDAFDHSDGYLASIKPDCLLILGDRWEILQAAIASHLRRVPIAHIAGGDVTLGSYDDAMRDCISRLAEWHFVTSWESFWNVYDFRTDGKVFMIGNIALDYIMHGDWKRERPIAEPYVVISYQAETIDGTNEIFSILKDMDYSKHWVFMLPNNDNGSAEIKATIREWCHGGVRNTVYESLPRAEFLNLLYHCDEFIGNSSAMLYEAPTLGVKCRMIGKRQKGRVAPTGDGNASERIREILCRYL